MDPFSCPPVLEKLPDVWRSSGLLFSTKARPLANMLIETGSMPRSDAIAYCAYDEWPEDCATYFDNLEGMATLCAHFDSVFQSPRHTTLYWVGKQDRLIGSLSVYTPPSDVHQQVCSDTLCIGYHVMESQRRQGLGSQMVTAFQQLAQTQGFTKLCAESNWHNRASHKILLKSGFTDFGMQPISVTTPCKSVESVCRRFMWQTDKPVSHPSAWPYAPGLAARLLPAP